MSHINKTILIAAEKAAQENAARENAPDQNIDDENGPKISNAGSSGTLPASVSTTAVSDSSSSKPKYSKKTDAEMIEQLEDWQKSPRIIATAKQFNQVNLPRS